MASGARTPPLKRTEPEDEEGDDGAEVVGWVAVAGRRYGLHRGPNTLGRAPDNDIVVACEEVSRHHVQLVGVCGGQAVVARDLGSSNGTCLRLGPRSRLALDPAAVLCLRPGDTLLLAGMPLTVLGPEGQGASQGAGLEGSETEDEEAAASPLMLDGAEEVAALLEETQSGPMAEGSGPGGGLEEDYQPSPTFPLPPPQQQAAAKGEPKEEAPAENIYLGSPTQVLEVDDGPPTPTQVVAESPHDDFIPTQRIDPTPDIMPSPRSQPPPPPHSTSPARAERVDETPQSQDYATAVGPRSADTKASPGASLRPPSARHMRSPAKPPPSPPPPPVDAPGQADSSTQQPKGRRGRRPAKASAVQGEGSDDEPLLQLGARPKRAPKKEPATNPRPKEPLAPQSPSPPQQPPLSQSPAPSPPHEPTIPIAPVPSPPAAGPRPLARKGGRAQPAASPAAGHSSAPDTASPRGRKRRSGGAGGNAAKRQRKDSPPAEVPPDTPSEVAPTRQKPPKTKTPKTKAPKTKTPQTKTPGQGAQGEREASQGSHVGSQRADTPSRRSGRTETTDHVGVLFTGTNIDRSYSDIIRTHVKGRKVERAQECTILIADEVKRTVKFLAAMCVCTHVLRPSWLAACKDLRMRIGPGNPSFQDHVLVDRPKEIKYGFSLATSLERARKRKLLSGLRVYRTDGVQPGAADMADIVECAGGSMQLYPPTEYTPGLLVISCSEDAGLWGLLVGLGHVVHSSELLLAGVLRQELDLHDPSCILARPDGDLPAPEAPAKRTAPATPSGRSRKRQR